MIKKFLPASIALLPYLALAAVDQTGQIEDLISTIAGFVNKLIGVAVSLAILFFFWGLAKYILNAQDETKKKEGRNIMIWGLVALFVMVSVWGLITFLQNAFGVDGGTAVDTNNLVPKQPR